MPDVISSLGMPRDLPPVRLGNTMQPLLLTVRLRTGTLDMAGGRVVAALYLRASDPDPVDVKFKISDLPPDATGRPRFRLDLSRDQVRELWNRAAASVSDTRPTSRTVHWTSSFEASTGERYPLTYGKLMIVSGASSVTG